MLLPSEKVGGWMSWTNPASSSPFAAQTISGITVKTDDTIVLSFLVHADTPSNVSFREVRLYSAYIGATYTITTTNSNTTRNMTINSNGTISFSESSSGASDAGRKYIVPVKIIIL